MTKCQGDEPHHHDREDKMGTPSNDSASDPVAPLGESARLYEESARLYEESARLYTVTMAEVTEGFRRLAELAETGRELYERDGITRDDIPWEDLREDARDVWDKSAARTAAIAANPVPYAREIAAVIADRDAAYREAFIAEVTRANKALGEAVADALATCGYCDQCLRCPCTCQTDCGARLDKAPGYHDCQAPGSPVRAK